MFSKGRRQNWSFSYWERTINILEKKYLRYLTCIFVHGIISPKRLNTTEVACQPKRNNPPLVCVKSFSHIFIVSYNCNCNIHLFQSRELCSGYWDLLVYHVYRLFISAVHRDFHASLQVRSYQIFVLTFSILSSQPRSQRARFLASH